MLQDIKDRVIRRALKIFALEGYDFDAVSMRELAFEEGLSQEELSAVFADKEALWEGILSFIPENIIHHAPDDEEIVELSKRLGAGEFLKRHSDFYDREKGFTIVELYYFMFSEMFRDNRIGEMSYRLIVDESRQEVVNILKRLGALGLIPQGNYLAIARLWNRTALIHGVLAPHQKCGFDCDRAYVEMTQFIISIITKGVPVIKVTDEDRQQFDLWIKKNAEMAELNEPVIFKALEMFSERGYRNVSIEDIAQGVRAQEPEAAFMFEDKLQVMLAAKQYFSKQYGIHFTSKAKLAELLKMNQPGIFVLAMAYNYPPVLLERVVQFYKVLFQEQYRDKALGGILLEYLENEEKIVREIIDYATQEGYFKPCKSERVAEAFVFTNCSLTFGAAVIDGKMERLDDIIVDITSLLTGLLYHGTLTP